MGTLVVEGILPWSSNYSFLVRVCDEGIELPAVYKPRRGERPLWDFRPGTLCLRERAAFLVSEALGWSLVPPTVLREGAHGLGSVQLFIEHDPERHYFTIEGEPAYRSQLQKMVLMDVLINNADRKGGHVLLEGGQDAGKTAVTQPERVWGIDHGICFHADYKLRTVIWEFAGETVPAALRDDLANVQPKLARGDSSLRQELCELLADDELLSMERRLDKLLRSGVFPNPGPGRHYPWPPV